MRSIYTALVLLALPAFAADCERVAETEEIAPGVYVRPGQYGRLFEAVAVANIGFVVGRECVAVIDSGGSHQEGAALSCAIRQVTALPVCYVIVSHHHPDHALGSLPFKQQGAQIIGHAKLARALAITASTYLARLGQQLGQTLDENYIVPPDRTVAVGEPLTLDLGGRVLRIEAHPPAHTDNDLSVLDEPSGTLWLADLLFVEHLPTIDASAKGWLEVLTALAKQPAPRAVPGHGPVAVPWPQAAEGVLRYLTTLREETRAWLAEGGELETAQEKIGYSERPRWQLFDEYHKRNVGRVYTELEWED